MGFGPLDLFAVFLGPLWLAKEAVKENYEHSVSVDREKRVKEIISNLSNEELEWQIVDFVDNPDNYEAIYEYLEEFKRRNPEWCKQREEPTGTVRGLVPTVGMNCLDWYNVGIERVSFFGGKRKYDQAMARDNRKICGKMILNTLGFETVNSATMKARKQVYGKMYDHHIW